MSQGESARIQTSSISGNPEQYLIDPTSEEAQQVIQQQQEQVQQQAQAQQAQQERILGLQEDLERMKDETNRYIQETKTRFDYYKADLDAEIKEAEITVEGIIKTEQQNNALPMQETSEL